MKKSQFLNFGTMKTMMNSFKNQKYFLWVKKKNRNKSNRLTKGIIILATSVTQIKS